MSFMAMVIMMVVILSSFYGDASIYVNVNVNIINFNFNSFVMIVMIMMVVMISARVTGGGVVMMMVAFCYDFFFTMMMLNGFQFVFYFKRSMKFIKSTGHCKVHHFWIYFPFYILMCPFFFCLMKEINNFYSALSAYYT